MDIKNWFVPTLSFFIFLYFLIFVGFYTAKITSANINLYESGGIIKQPESDAEKMLSEISKSIKK